MSALLDILALNRSIWCGLVVMGAEFLLVAQWIKEDRIFFLLGAHLFLISMIAGIDIWILNDPLVLEKTHGKAYLDFWGIAYQILACAYLAATIWMTRMLTNRPGNKAALAQSALLGAFAAAFLADLALPQEIFMQWQDKQWHTTWRYDWVFAPFIFGVFAWVIYNVLLAIPAAPAAVKRTLKSLAIAYFVLLAGGLLDLIVMSNGGDSVIPSYGEFGVLAIGIMGTLIFSDKMIALYTGQRLALLKIEEINGTMEANRPLGLIGSSAAKVSEEIRSQVSILKSHSRGLAEPRYPGHHAEVTRIENARISLEKYATGILDFSGSSRLGPVSFTRPEDILRTAMGMLPPGIAEKVRISGAGADRIAADPHKLARAIYEILKNAADAEAQGIYVRLRQGMGIACIAIEDDGKGCLKEDAGKICRPFFTTRKESGALGLGASIAEGIILAHGGLLRLHPKAGTDGSMRGLLANILLPLEGRSSLGAEEGRGQCRLVSDQTDLVTEVLAICGNLGTRLSVLGAGADAGGLRSNPGDGLVILDDRADGDASRWARRSHRGPVFTCGPDRMLHPLSGASAGEALRLSEESVLLILAGRTPRAGIQIP